MLEVLFVTVPLIVYGVLDNNNKPSKRLGMTTTTTRRTSWASLNHEKVSVPVWNPQDSVCSIAMATRRRSSTVNRASIEEILKSGDNTQPAAPPSPHFTTSSKRMSTTSTTSTTSGAMEPPQSTRPLSFTPRTRPNRLSLQFPVSTSTTTESARPTPTSSNAPSVPATPNMAAMPSPNDPTAFLEALAGQERKVLELKEELEKAEKDLDILKKKWAYHEATKKRQEVRHVEQLQPLQTVATGSGDSKSEEKTLRRSLEQDRRRSMLANIQVESRRRVFSGSHTRTLSLLSPERSTHGQAQPFPSVRETSTDSRNSEHSLPRSTTMPDTSQGISRISSQRGNRHSFQGPSTDGVKQIAQDVKAGLWTFLEDLRQATVGDEAVNGTSHHSTDGSSLHGHNHNRRGSKGSLLTSGRGRNTHSKSPVRTWDNVVGASPEHGHDLLGHDWPEKSADGQAKKPSLKKKRSKSMIALTTPSVIDSLDDDWANWDSPTPNSPRWSGSTLQDPLTPSNHSTMKSIETDTPPKQSGEIPWPDLQNLKQNLTPSHLHRTVSTIMKEWEKSLTPPPEDRQDPLNNSKTESQSQPQSNSTVFSNIDACLM